GGHSLLATRLQSRVRHDLGVELPLRIVFEQPTGAGLASRVGAAVRREEGLEAPPLCRVARRDHLPLSFAQQRLWFLDQLESGSAVYNIPTSLALTGRLHRRALSRALSEIVRRHEVLRTRFAMVDGEPYQVIEPECELPLPIVDLGALGEPEGGDEFHRLVSAAARRPFDLARGPVLRAALLRRSSDEHALLLEVHHVAFDGWSAGIFLNELAVLYRAFSEGQSSPLPELPVQYADFAVWQRQWLRGEVLERQLGYWREQLAGLPVLELPTDRPRPAVQSFRDGSESFRLPSELHERLRALNREHGTTMFMTLLAAFQALLARTTDEQDLAVGTVVAGRNRAEIEGLLGFFVNTLVLRADLSGWPSGWQGQTPPAVERIFDRSGEVPESSGVAKFALVCPGKEQGQGVPVAEDRGISGQAPLGQAPLGQGELTFRELLDRVRETALGAYAHQDVPFEQLVEALEPERNLSQNPLAQVLFLLQNA
ncbi:MAG: hypothetical protein GY856_28475, partial [bacterium]|nr:hypothetical protein [bacterium]